MKCGKCGEEVSIQPGKSANFCSNCGNKIEAEKANGWKYFDNTKELLAYVAAEYGNDALFGRKYFTDHSSPMLPQGQKNLVKQAFDCGAVKILQDNVNSDQARKEIAVKQAVKKLTDLMFSQEAAERVVWEFTNAIGWGMSEPQGGKLPPDSGGNVVPPPPPPPPPPPDDIRNLMMIGWQSADVGDWKEAGDYFTKAREKDPSYSPAFLGLICVDLKCPQEDKLANVKDPGSITNHKYYKFAVADPTVKASVDGYVQIIKDRIDAEQKAAAAEAELKRKTAEEAARRKRVQEAFDNACEIMNNAQSLDDYRNAIATFGNIDSNYQDISGQIKNNVAECERKMQQMAAELDKVLAPLREKFSPAIKAEKQAKLQEQRKADKERIDAENAKTKADVGAKCSQIQQKFGADHKAWQEEYNRLKVPYDTEYKKWENEANTIKAQAEQWKSQGLCPHCGGMLKGLFAKKCTRCGKAPSDPIIISLAPAQPDYPAEPKMPQMPTFTPKALDESKYVLKDDANSVINQQITPITLAGIEWRILDVQGSKLLLISEKILEKRPYNVERKDITWENCTLRKYLNYEFLNKLGVIKPGIAETRNGNSNNPWWGTAVGNATTDKVFLLSLDELVKYFGDSGDLRNKRKKDHKGNNNSSGFCVHDQYNNARIANYGSEWASWWLRSPGLMSTFAACVAQRGFVVVDGGFVDEGLGVRPALWLNL